MLKLIGVLLLVATAFVAGRVSPWPALPGSVQSAEVLGITHGVYGTYLAITREGVRFDPGVQPAYNVLLLDTSLIDGASEHDPFCDIQQPPIGLRCHLESVSRPITFAVQGITCVSLSYQRAHNRHIWNTSYVLRVCIDRHR